MRGLRVDHPRVRPPGRPLCGNERSDRQRRLLGSHEVDLVRPGRSDDRLAGLERRDRVRVRDAVPVLADVRPLLLQEVDRSVELVLVELVRILDAEVRLGRLQVDGSVGDEDLVVVDRQLALVVGAGPDRLPASGVLRKNRVVEDHLVHAAPMWHAVTNAVDRVVRLPLEALVHVRVVRDQVEVHRRDVFLRNEPQRCVARRRDAVVRARRDEIDHVVGAGTVLRVHLAAGLLGELVGPRLVRVAGPDDEVDLALAPRVGLDLLERRAEALDLRARRASLVAAAAAGRDHTERADEQTQRCPNGNALPSHSDPPSDSSITDSCSGRHPTCTRRPSHLRAPHWSPLRGSARAPVTRRHGRA